MHRTQDWWRRPTILVALGMVGLGAALLWPHITPSVSPPSRAEEPQGLALNSMGTELLVRPDPRPVSVPSDPVATPEPASVVVYISGAVAHPDVYVLPHDARVKDVVVAAGGLAADADNERINLAALIYDAQHIHVPQVRPVTEPQIISVIDSESQADMLPSSGDSAYPDAVANVQRQNRLINLNTAGPAELEELTGIGPALAQRIIDHRNTNGPFTSIDELPQVKGIGPVVFERIRDQVTVGH